MSNERTQFEAWINNPHMLNHREHPATWGASEDECQRHEANPYSHPYTKGAWEAWKARALLAEAQPEPVGEPTDEQLDKTLFKALRDYMEQGSPFGGPTDEKQLDRAKARAVLADWGRPAPEPVSVAERMPTAQDCGADGLCWFWYPGIYEACFPWWSLEPFERGEQATHWLPHWALPVPQEHTP